MLACIIKVRLLWNADEVEAASREKEKSLKTVG